MIKRLLVLTVVALGGYIGASCSPEDVAEPTAPPESRAETSLALAGQQYLPYGVPAPDTLPPNVIPEPYDPRKHGPPKPNSLPYLAIPPQQRTRTSPTRTIPQGGMSRGLRWGYTPSEASYNGYFSNNEVATELTVPYNSGYQNVVFAPTALPAGSACIEMATTHRRYTGVDIGVTRHLAGWWDFCLPSGLPTQASYEEDMANPTWQSSYSYVSYLDNQRYFTIQVSPNGPGCWIGLMYNFGTGYWEQKHISCYPAGRTQNWRNNNEGWSLHEANGRITKTCPNMSGVWARMIQVYNPNTGWHDINTIVPSLNQGDLCWIWNYPSWNMFYTDGGSGSNWHAVTPNY